MLIVDNSRQTARKNESCYQCGRTIKRGTTYFRVDQYLYADTIICSNRCLKDFSAPIQDKIPTFEKSLLGMAFSGTGKLARKGFKSLNSSMEETKKRNIELSEKEKSQIQEKASEISKFSFSEDVNELKNEIEELILIRKNLKSNELPVKKIIYEKLMFGLERLRQKGERTSFYSGRIEELKPSLWDKINHFFTSS